VFFEQGEKRDSYHPLGRKRGVKNSTGNARAGKRTSRARSGPTSTLKKKIARSAAFGMDVLS